MTDPQHSFSFSSLEPTDSSESPEHILVRHRTGKSREQRVGSRGEIGSDRIGSRGSKGRVICISLRRANH